jgi:hypothetical protein
MANEFAVDACGLLDPGKAMIVKEVSDIEERVEKNSYVRDKEGDERIRMWWRKEQEGTTV